MSISAGGDIAAGDFATGAAVLGGGTATFGAGANGGPLLAFPPLLDLNLDTILPLFCLPAIDILATL